MIHTDGRDGTAHFEFSDGTIITRYGGQITRGMVRKMKRPIKVTFDESKLVIRDEVDRGKYEQWKRMCLQTIGDK